MSWIPKSFSSISFSSVSWKGIVETVVDVARSRGGTREWALKRQAAYPTKKVGWKHEWKKPKNLAILAVGSGVVG